VKVCSEEGCGRQAVALGMCQRHYRRKKRGSTQDRPGHPTLYPKTPEKPYKGAPRMELRLDPEVQAWVLAHGGPAWARRVLSLLYLLRDDPDLAALLLQADQPWEG